MTVWIIEPRDPLIVRDGRPFGPNPGARAASLPFPMPSTVVGGLRSKAGLDAAGFFDPSTIETVLKLSLRGPLLVELAADQDTVKQFLFPAPADALVLDADAAQSDGKKRLRIQRLAPRLLPGAPTTNVPDGLALLAPPTRIPNKVSKHAPHFWHEKMFEHWLTAAPEDIEELADSVGLGALEVSSRTHVSIDPYTQTARDEALFQTRGLEFTWRDREAERWDVFVTSRLALVAAFEQDNAAYVPPHFQQGLSPLGGERRLMRWFTLEKLFPEPPNQLFATITKTRRARVMLLTPAIFQAAYRPQLQWVRGGVTATVRAAAVPRSQVVSGWDMKTGTPKPTRRLAPAGAVYFITWEDGADVGAWLDATWMRNVSDGEQDQRDGFGLAAIGVWPELEKEPQQ